MTSTLKVLLSLANSVCSYNLVAINKMIKQTKKISGNIMTTIQMVHLLLSSIPKGCLAK